MRREYIEEPQADVLSAIRRHNRLLFDFVLKRTIRIGGKAFNEAPFQTREFFARATSVGTQGETKSDDRSS